MKGFVIIAVFVMIEEIGNYLVKQSCFFKKRLQGTQKFMEGVPDGIEIACIGSGAGMHGISFENCGKKGFNFCTAPQNFSYGHKIIRQYKEKLEKLCIMIIIICPMSFGNNNDTKKIGYSDKYYYFLNHDEIDNYSMARNFILQRPFLLFAGKAMQKLLGKLGRKDNFSKGYTIIQTWKEEFDLEDLQDAGQAANHRETFRQKIAGMEEEITFLKENTFRPLFVVPPVPEVTRKEISEEFLKEFCYDNLNEIAEKEKIPVLDYFKDERIKPEMFSGDFFLNETGRNVFSKILLEDVDGIL